MADRQQRGGSGTQLVVTGEGGMLVTDDERLHARAIHLWDQARGPSTLV